MTGDLAAPCDSKEVAMVGQAGAARPVPTPLCLLARRFSTSWKSDASNLPLGSQWKVLLLLVMLFA